MQALKKHWKPLLTIIGLFLAAGAILVEYTLAPRKQLQVLLEASIPLVDVRPEAADNITILYNDQPVSNAILYQIRLENTGNQPILPSDYIRPIVFSIAPPNEIADVSIVDLEPPSVDIKISKTSQYQAELTPALLNVGDSVTVRLAIVTKHSEDALNDIWIGGRIVDVKEIKLTAPAEESTVREVFSTVAKVSGVLVMLLIIGVIVLAIMNRRRM
jgi:hypothetical protein